MFARVNPAFVVLALPILAAASAVRRTTPPPATTPASQCNTGDLSCCNSTEMSDDLSGPTKTLFGLLGIVLGPVVAMVALDCSPLTIIGGGGSSCTQQPVCCSNNNFNGLVNIGCTPVNVNL